MVQKSNPLIATLVTTMMKMVTGIYFHQSLLTLQVLQVLVPMQSIHALAIQVRLHIFLIRTLEVITRQHLFFRR